jgi:hypothetical protein
MDCRPPIRCAWARSQIGPEALSLAVVLNKELGLSHERTARVLELGYGFHGAGAGYAGPCSSWGIWQSPMIERTGNRVRDGSA